MDNYYFVKRNIRFFVLFLHFFRNISENMRLSAKSSETPSSESAISPLKANRSGQIYPLRKDF